ncbi:MAG TPA: hypothetical protein VLM37_11280 [Fibrobacteraceae bacterium]|nr:hypothetical protein [Fibrobacteraceae bacterium]
MKKIPVKEIQDGMVLAQPVTGAGGNILLGPGTVLKTSFATRLTSWGVAAVWIEADANIVSEEQNSKEITEKERIDALFEGRLVNPAMTAIYQATLQFHGWDHATQ